MAEILKELERSRRPLDLVLACSENLKVPWNAQQLAEHGHFELQSASSYCASSEQISGR